MTQKLNQESGDSLQKYIKYIYICVCVLKLIRGGPLTYSRPIYLLAVAYFFHESYHILVLRI